MKSLPNRSDVLVLSGVGNNSCQTILNTLQLTKIKGQESPKQRITVVKSTPNQSIRSHQSSMMCQVTSETLKIPDLSKTGTYRYFGHASKRKNHYQTIHQGS